MDMNTSIKFVKGVGEARGKLFAKLSVGAVGELLYFFPRDYEDWSSALSIHEAPLNESCCVKAIVSHTPTSHRAGGGVMLYKTTVTDGAALMNLTFFNNKYVVEQLKEGEEYLFFGKVGINIYGGREMLSPRFAKPEYSERIRPIYRGTESLSSKTIERCMENALESVRGDLKETLPDYLIKKHWERKHGSQAYYGQKTQ